MTRARGATHEEPELPVLLGQIVDEKYRVDRLLGAGGMGVVVVATHVELGQQVALKFLIPRALRSEEARQRFLREARAAVRLRSEHVARVFDVGALTSGEPYIVMEYLEGSDLSTYATAHAPLRLADAVEFVLQGCEAIVEAHSLGIVHRDLKPHNLFVTRRVNGSPLVKVLDFGISKALAPYGSGELDLTDSNVVLGSPLYMAPEQMKSARSADARSDIWSLGVILYELLTGQVPFDGESMTEVCLKVVNEPPAPPRQLRGDLPEALAAVVLRCLEKDPSARYQNVAKLAEALEPFSTSGQRGTGERAWRSLVDTADAQDFGGAPVETPAPSELRPIPSSPPPHARTDITWGDTQSSPKALAPRSRPRRRGVFLFGLLAGIAATVAVGVGVFSLRAHTREVAATPSVELSAPPQGALPTRSAAMAPEPAVSAVPAASASAGVAADVSSAAIASARPPSLLRGHAPAASARGSSHRTNVRPSGSEGAAAPPSAPAATPTAPNGAPILH